MRIGNRGKVARGDWITVKEINPGSSQMFTLSVGGIEVPGFVEEYNVLARCPHDVPSGTVEVKVNGERAGTIKVE